MTRLTKREAAELLDVSKTTVYDWLNKGLLPYVQVGHRRLLYREQLEKWINDSTCQPAGERAS